MEQTEQQVERSRIKRLTMWIGGGLLMAIAGNAMWEITRPGLLWVGKFVLSLSTLGMNGLRDDLYVDIAKGNFDWFGMWLSTMTGAMLTVFFLLPPVVLWTLRDLDKKREARKSPTRRKFFAAVDSFVSSNWLLGIQTVLVLVLVFVQTSRIVYIQQAANYTVQLQRIVAPHVTPQELLLLESRFAQVDSRAAYVKLVTDLRGIAKKHKSTVPEFEVF